MVRDMQVSVRQGKGDHERLGRQKFLYCVDRFHLELLVPYKRIHFFQVQNESESSLGFFPQKYVGEEASFCLKPQNPAFCRFAQHIF